MGFLFRASRLGVAGRRGLVWVGYMLTFFYLNAVLVCVCGGGHWKLLGLAKSVQSRWVRDGWPVHTQRELSLILVPLLRR